MASGRSEGLVSDLGDFFDMGKLKDLPKRDDLVWDSMEWNPSDYELNLLDRITGAPMAKYEHELTGDMKTRIENDFRYHAPKDDQPERYILIREKARELALVIVGNSPRSREQSVALTELDHVVMMANAAIARNE